MTEIYISSGTLWRSEEIEGWIRFRQHGEGVIEGQFECPVGAKAVGLPHRAFDLAVQALNGPLDICFGVAE